jgi:hypothetical protein
VSERRHDHSRDSEECNDRPDNDQPKSEVLQPVEIDQVDGGISIFDVPVVLCNGLDGKYGIRYSLYRNEAVENGKDGIMNTEEHVIQKRDFLFSAIEENRGSDAIDD